jgi:hypothetical protein
VVNSLATSNQAIWFGPMPKEEQVVVAASVKLDVPAGKYRLSLAIGEVDPFDPGRSVFHDLVKDAIQIEVEKSHDSDKREGVAFLNMSIHGV